MSNHEISRVITEKEILKKVKTCDKITLTISVEEAVMLAALIGNSTGNLPYSLYIHLKKFLGLPEVYRPNSSFNIYERGDFPRDVERVKEFLNKDL